MPWFGTHEYPFRGWQAALIHYSMDWLLNTFTHEYPFWGWQAALIHYSMDWLLNTEVSKGHLELLQIILAKGQSRKMCWMDSGGPLQIGQFQASRSLDSMNLPMFDLTSKEFQTIFQSKCFNLCWSFKLHRQFQSSESKGEGLVGWGCSVLDECFEFTFFFFDK